MAKPAEIEGEDDVDKEGFFVALLLVADAVDRAQGFALLTGPVGLVVMTAPLGFRMKLSRENDGRGIDCSASADPGVATALAAEAE